MMHVCVCILVWDPVCVCVNKFVFPVYEKHGSTYNFNLYVGETD